MANRIQLMRATLPERLVELGSPLDWEHISNQVGWVCVVFWASIWWFCDWSLITKVSWDLLLMYDGAGWDVLLLRLNP